MDLALLAISFVIPIEGVIAAVSLQQLGVSTVLYYLAAFDYVDPVSILNGR